MNTIPSEKIESMLLEYVHRVHGQSFNFRPQQKEAILDILDAFFSADCNLYLLDAPTGSGKSMIAIITAGFLSELQFKGYILASDLMLQSQYENDFSRNRLNWGSVKGVDNYTCIVNNEKFSIGDCRLKNIGYEEAEKLPCFNDCGYLYNRRKAIKSPVTLLNYNFWIIQRNYTEPKMLDAGKGIPFPKRDFTICDEAHRLCEIVQNHFSPKIDSRTEEKLEKIRTILKQYNIGSLRFSTSRLKIVIKHMFNEQNSQKLAAQLKEFELILSEFVKRGDDIKKYVSSLYKTTEVPKMWKINLGLVDWVKDMHCKFEDYNHILANTGIETMVKNVQGEQVIFNCIDETYMMDKHYHQQCGFKLMMSATVGDPISFLRNVGAENARYFKIDSHFDYEKSPIYYYPNKRMSASFKETTIPWVCSKIEEILNNHKNESGIIHSGSYEITSRIIESLSDSNKQRVLYYQGSFEKEQMIKRFLEEENLILIGPSILEGLDLHEDKSRLQIFVKVPYPSLGDSFVKAKMNYRPDWYNWKSASSILQGVGRSVRNENDWCVTYFLDGCLSDLFRNARSNFPIEFQKRIVIMNE